MKSSLRKGTTSFEFQYESGCEDIHAILTSVEIEDKVLIVSTDLKPSNDNQRADLNMLLRHKESITDIVVREDQVRKNLVKFHNGNKGKFERQKLRVQFKESTIFAFDVKLRSVDENGVGFEVVV